MGAALVEELVSMGTAVHLQWVGRPAGPGFLRAGRTAVPWLSSTVAWRVCPQTPAHLPRRTPGLRFTATGALGGTSAGPRRARRCACTAQAAGRLPKALPFVLGTVGWELAAPLWHQPPQGRPWQGESLPTCP